MPLKSPDDEEDFDPKDHLDYEGGPMGTPRAAEKMSDAEYAMIQSQMTMIAQMTAMLDIKNFQKELNEAETLSFVLDPTLARDSMRKVRQVKELASAVAQLKAVYNKHVKEDRGERP